MGAYNWTWQQQLINDNSALLLCWYEVKGAPDIQSFFIAQTYESEF